MDFKAGSSSSVAKSGGHRSAIAKQCDGFHTVMMKNAPHPSGQIVAEVPNGEMLSVLATNPDIQWDEREIRRLFPTLVHLLVKGSYWVFK